MVDLVDQFNIWDLPNHTYEEEHKGRCACGKVEDDAHVPITELCTCLPEEELTSEEELLNEAGL